MSSGDPGDREPRIPAGNLRRRVVSAAILGPVALGATWAGGVPFGVLMWLMASLGLAEWLTMARRNGAVSAALWWVNLGGLAALAAIALVWQVWLAALAGAAYLAGLAVVLKLTATPRLVVVLGGLPYVGAAMLSLIWLRSETGADWTLVLWLLLVVWATDIGGYAAGRLIGGRKLMPSISPRKTWAGAVGSVVAALAVGGGLALVLEAGRPAPALAVALVACLAAQAGDLFESAVKRHYGVKDRLFTRKST